MHMFIHSLSLHPVALSLTQVFLVSLRSLHCPRSLLLTPSSFPNPRPLLLLTLWLRLRLRRRMRLRMAGARTMRRALAPKPKRIQGRRSPWSRMMGPLWRM